MLRGTVKWYDESKRFGFILPSDGGPDIFVHRTGIRNPDRRLTEGQQVEFETEQNEKGVHAVDVRIVAN